MRRVSLAIMMLCVAASISAAQAANGPVPSSTSFTKSSDCKCIHADAVQGKTIKMKVSITSGDPIGTFSPNPGENVTFSLTHGADALITQVVQTDSSGNAEATFDLSRTDAAPHDPVPTGSYTMSAAYDGDDNAVAPGVGLSPSSVSQTFTVRGTVLAYTGPSRGVTGSVANLVATLTYDGAGVVGETVSFKLGTQTVSGVTDNFGTATAPVMLSQPAGTYTLTASFAGDTAKNYVAASDTASFVIADSTVTSTPVVTIVSPAEGGALISAPKLPDSAPAQLTSEIDGTASSTFPISQVLVDLVNDQTQGGISGSGFANLSCDSSTCLSTHWTYNTNFFLPPGTYTLHVTAADANGGSTEVTRSVVLV